jgi:DNA-directed RNA polymerase specialized sigma54-like protein
MPKLRINDLYAQAIRGSRGAASGGPGLSSRLQEARWFMKNIQQRFDTIQRVSQAIVERQKSFFTHGEIAMKPLVLREIADELGLHESTISRVTTAKVHVHALRHLRAEVFLRFVAQHRGRRQCVEHRRARLIKQLVRLRTRSSRCPTASCR